MKSYEHTWLPGSSFPWRPPPLVGQRWRGDRRGHNPHPLVPKACPRGRCGGTDGNVRDSSRSGEEPQSGWSSLLCVAADSRGGYIFPFDDSKIGGAVQLTRNHSFLWKKIMYTLRWTMNYCKKMQSYALPGWCYLRICVFWGRQFYSAGCSFCIQRIPQSRHHPHCKQKKNKILYKKIIIYRFD